MSAKGAISAAAVAVGVACVVALAVSRDTGATKDSALALHESTEPAPTVPDSSDLRDRRAALRPSSTAVDESEPETIVTPHPNVHPLPHFHAGEAVTARDFLQAYWGSRWPEVQDAVDFSSYDLDQEIDPNRVLPFAEVEARLQESLSLEDPEELDSRAAFFESPAKAAGVLETSSYNPTGKSLTPDDRRALQKILDDFNPHIRELATAHLLEESSERRRLIRDGEFMLGPLAAAPTHNPDTAAPGITSTSTSVGGWQAGLSIRAEPGTPLGSSYQAVLDMRQARDRELRAFIDSL